MVLKKKSKRKSRPSRGKVSRARIPKPRITLEPQPSPRSLYERLLKKHNLKPADILSQRDIGPELILVTKNGMKLRVSKD